MPPAITAARTVAPREAAKHFDFIDDIWFLLLISNKPEMVSATAEPSGLASVSRNHLRVDALAVI
jgi:hypothetical protein